MREPMVTRTIQTTKAVVMVVNTLEGETYTKEVIVPRTYKDDKALLKKVSPIIEAEENMKAVHIVTAEVIETLYGMTEQEFIEKASVMPPRNKSGETSEGVE